MSRISLPSRRVSAPIIHSAIARVGETLTASAPSWNHQNDMAINKNNSKYILREMQEPAKLSGVAGRTFVSASTVASSFPFLPSSSENAASSRNKWPPNRCLFRQYPVFAFFTPSRSSSITSSTLFTSKCFCSSASPPSTLSEAVASDAKTISTTPECEASPDKFFFDPEVIKHVVSKVAKDETLKAVFAATDRELAGSSSAQKIDKNNIASRYDEVADKLKDDSSDVATKFKKGLVLPQMIDALATLKIIAPTILGRLQQTEYSLLVGTIFFLCSFVTNTNRITAELVKNHVRDLDPYCHLGKLGAMVANDIWMKTRDRESITKNLITSTFQRAEKLAEARNKYLPEILHLTIKVHSRQRDDSLRDQCDFVSESHTTVACTEDGKGTCASRFVSPKSGAGLANSFQLQWSPKGKKEQSNFDSDIVNIVSGASGSGKTISSLICGATAALPVYCLLLHAKSDCGATDLDDSNAKLNRNDAAFDLLKKGILKIMYDPDEQKDVGKSDRKFSISAKPWSGVLRIVVDEIGTHPVFLRALCAVWQYKRSDMAEFLGVSQDQLQLVAVGTGADNFELSKLGPVKGSYKVLTVARNDEIFKKLFLQKMKRMPATTQRPPALQLYKLLFCENPALEDGAPDATSLPSPTSDPVFRAMLRLVTNARCAAIILSLMHRTFIGPQSDPNENSSMTKTRGAEWPLVQLRASASYWCIEAVNIYCSMNAMARLDSRERHYSLGRAIAYDLNRSLCMKGVDEDARENEWTRYGVRFGLLSDTAREIKEGDSTMQQVFTQTWTDSSDDEPKLHQQQFGIPFGTSRFRVDDAFVMMFLLMSGTASNDVFAKNHTNDCLLFEEAMFDFQRIAAQFGHRHPALSCADDGVLALDAPDTSRRGHHSINSTIPDSTADAKVFDNDITLSDAAKAKPSTVPMTLDDHGFTPPHLLYGLGCKTVYSARLSFKLENAALTPTKKTKKLSIILPEVIQQSARMWREKVQQGDAIVLLNGDNASCADIITLARNRIIFTQCKNADAASTLKITTEICKMRRKELLGLLCWCVDTTNAKEPVEIFYVVAGGVKKAFSEDCTETSPDGAIKKDCDATKIKYFANDRYAAFNTNAKLMQSQQNDGALWEMAPPDAKSFKLRATVQNGDDTASPATYLLRESIHFTYAYAFADDDANDVFPYSPVLKSNLPTTVKASESDYSCMQRFDYDQPDCDAAAGQMDLSCVSAPQVDNVEKNKMNKN